jgi:ATP-binding cassette subfamily B protein
MFGIVAAFAVASSTRFYLVTWLGERVAADLRRDLFQRVLGLSQTYFEQARTGDILSRLTADIAVLQALIGSAISMGARNTLTGLGSFAMLIVTSPRLAAIVAVVAPLVVGPMLVFGRREKRLSRESQDRIADLGAYAEETINGLRAVQAFTYEEQARGRFAATVERSFQTAARRISTRAMLILVVILLGFGAVTFALWIGGRDVVSGRMTGGELSAFVLYAVLLATSGASLSEVWGDVQRAAGAAGRLLELLAEEPSIRAPAMPAHLPSPVRGRIAFEDVTFEYPTRPGQSALAGLSLTVEPGETVALVGPSGAGKTTVLQLLLRFYDPSTGTVRLDGVDIATLDPAELRGCIGLVPQEPVIFSADAWENIRFGRPDATDADVRSAAEAAAADGFLTSFQTVSTRFWAPRESCCPAVSASAWRSPERSCATRRCCCSTKPPARSMPNRNRRCSARCRRCPRDGRHWWWRTGWRPSGAPIASSCSTMGVSRRSARMTNSPGKADCTRGLPLAVRSRRWRWTDRELTWAGLIRWRATPSPRQ